jgi:hypothetical protein
MTFGVKGGFAAALQLYDGLRLSIGIEHIDDILADLDQSLCSVSANGFMHGIALLSSERC